MSYDLSIIARVNIMFAVTVQFLGHCLMIGNILRCTLPSYVAEKRNILFSVYSTQIRRLRCNMCILSVKCKLNVN